MKKLAGLDYEKAVKYLNEQARPLERALYQYHFEGGAGDAVLSELAAYQNADGGFGRGLGPDIRLDDSSVNATAIAFQRLREISAPADHPVVVNACRYLVATYNEKRINWPIIPINIDDAPHAPWWGHGGDLEKSMCNPRVGLAGYANDYPEHFPMREALTQAVFDYLFQQPDQMEMHDLLSYIQFWETKTLPDEKRARVLDKLLRVVENTVERDATQWKNYVLSPLFVVSSPESPFAALFPVEIEQNLDYLIDCRNESGVWEPNWSWGGLWPEVWALARREWTGVQTLSSLRKLKAFGRID